MIKEYEAGVDLRPKSPPALLGAPGLKSLALGSRTITKNDGRGESDS